MTLARWIKYEEDLNAEKGQWGKPHVATLSFKALVNLRLCMEGGTLMLDVTVRDLPELLHRYRNFRPSSLSSDFCKFQNFPERYSKHSFKVNADS